MNINKDDNIKNKTCPYCQANIKSDANIIICELCGTSHHKECWDENKGCTTYGCSNNPNTDSKDETTFGSIDIGNQTIDEIERDLETEREKAKDTVNCPKCNIPIDKNSYFCNHCGFYLKEDTSKKGKEQFEKEYQKRYKEKAAFSQRRLLITTGSILILTALVIITFYFSYKAIYDYFSSDKYQEQQEIKSFVSDWEKAWESKDINKYQKLLDKDYIYYDKNGKKINYQGKIKRIKYTFDKYEYIEIDVSDIKIEKSLDNPNYINVTFNQRYKSDKFEETGIKTLRLYRSDDTENQWKIFREYFEESE